MVTRKFLLICSSIFALTLPYVAFAQSSPFDDPTYDPRHTTVPIRWCGVARAQAVDNPGVLGLASPTEFLSRRIGEAAKSHFTGDSWAIQLRASLAPFAQFRNAMAFPRIYTDTRFCENDLKRRLGRDALSEAELAVCDVTAVDQDVNILSLRCRDAWENGDELFFAPATGPRRELTAQHRRLSMSEIDLELCERHGQEHPDHLPCESKTAGTEQRPIPLVPLNEQNEKRFGFLDCLGEDGTQDGIYQPGEPIYRDDDSDGRLSEGDVLISPLSSSQTRPLFLTHGDQALTACEERLREVSKVAGEVFQPKLIFDDGKEDGKGQFDRVHFLDNIPLPRGAFSLGYSGHFWGVYAISAQKLVVSENSKTELLGFHRQHGSLAVNNCNVSTVILPDPSRFARDFPEVERWIVAHEIGHALGLPHGNGSALTNTEYSYAKGEVQSRKSRQEPGRSNESARWKSAIENSYSNDPSECSDSNVMQYCWEQQSSGEDPRFIWQGPKTSEERVSFDEPQVERMLKRIECCRDPSGLLGRDEHGCVLRNDRGADGDRFGGNLGQTSKRGVFEDIDMFGVMVDQ